MHNFSSVKDNQKFMNGPRIGIEPLIISSTKNVAKDGGGKRDRTDDLYAASVALSQLSYTPTFGMGIIY